MELNQLRYLVKLGEVQNFSKAAEELYIAQPTLSQQINRLEQELGVKLFERSTRKVVLTEIGKTCVSYAAAALENIDEVKNASEKYRRREKSRLLIGMLNILPRMDMMNVISEFQETHPETKIEWNFGWSVDLIELLLQKKLDVVISNVVFDESDPMYQKLNVQPFQEDYLVAVVNKNSPLAQRTELRIEDIVHETFWVVDNHASVKLGIENAISALGYPIPAFEECNSMVSVFKMIAANQGISVMSSGVAQEYHIPHVRSIPIVPRIARTTALMTVKDAKLSGKQADFIRFFLDAIEKQQV